MNAADRQALIHDCLVERLAPVALQVLDESHQHNVPKGAQSHFKVLVVSEGFAGLSLVARHRRVHDELAAFFGPGGIHALSIHAHTPAEWLARGQVLPPSPPCRGGSRSAS